MVKKYQARPRFEPSASRIPSLNSTTELPNHMSICLMIYHQIPVPGYIYFIAKMSLNLSACLLISEPTIRPTKQPTNQSNETTYQPTNLLISLSMRSSAHHTPSTYQYNVSPSVQPTICPPAHLFIHPSPIHFFVCQLVHPSSQPVSQPVNEPANQPTKNITGPVNTR